jgi:nanoRNase/pAp phosphatase (c-di-AMP/oligoRNAs hydrolase)
MQEDESLRVYLSRVIREIVRSPPRVLIFTHRQADPDALCAAFGLANVLSLLAGREIQSKIIVPQGASTLGETVCKELGINFETVKDTKELPECDLIFVVDTGDSQLLQPFADLISSNKALKIQIDHHSGTTETFAHFTRSFVNSNSTSTCEIVAMAFSDFEFPKRVSQALITGLMFDSQHFGIATTSTLEAALILLRAGAEIDVARKILRRKPDRSEVLARVKSAQRLQFEEIGKYIVLKTEVSSFHASVARMLVEIGADVGIAYGKSDGEARVSIRSTQSFFKETGIDFAEEVKKVAVPSQIFGGGHPTAASMSGGDSPKDLASALVEGIRNSLLNN